MLCSTEMCIEGSVMDNVGEMDKAWVCDTRENWIECRGIKSQSEDYSCI